LVIKDDVRCQYRSKLCSDILSLLKKNASHGVQALRCESSWRAGSVVKRGHAGITAIIRLWRGFSAACGERSAAKNFALQQFSNSLFLLQVGLNAYDLLSASTRERLPAYVILRTTLQYIS
jgi:hypothetical protein